MGGETKSHEKVVTEYCAQCGGTDFTVHHYMRDSHHDRMYLECSKCGHFHARVVVHAYLDPNPEKSYEFFLKKSIIMDNVSGRKTLAEYKFHAEKAIQQFKHVKEMIAKHAGEPKSEASIPELFIRYHIIEDG